MTLPTSHSPLLVVFFIGNLIILKSASKNIDRHQDLDLVDHSTFGKNPLKNNVLWQFRQFGEKALALPAMRCERSVLAAGAKLE